jgi:prepilin-type N-terminal cleavage/methylation domain-containing protein
MKKRIRGQKAFTLIETLLAISLFAAIALPLLTVFLQSTKADRAARDVLNANYISQDYIEKLDTKTYKEALQDVPSLQSKNGYYLSATIEPYGNAKSMFSANCVYVHLIMLSNGTMLAVLPDGKWRQFSSLPGSISMSVSGGQYTLNCSGTVVSGTTKYNNCAVIINAVNKTAGVSTAVSLGATCRALVYCSSAEASKITVTGTSQFHKDLITGTTSLIRVKASVYQKTSDSQPLAVSDAFINIRNEL